MKDTRIFQLTNELLEESDDEAIRCFLRDIFLIREYFQSELAGDLAYGQKYKFRVALSEKYSTSIKTVEAAIFGPKRAKVRNKIVNEIKKEIRKESRLGK